MPSVVYTDTVIAPLRAVNKYVSKDGDFNNLSFLFGAPPKVVWIQLGNCSTRDIEMVLRTRHGDVLAFNSDPASALLVLGPQSHS